VVVPLIIATAALVSSGPARAQTPQVRLAAPASCPVNVNCIPGFKRVYGVDPSGSYVRLRVADAGVQALDDGIAEVATVFTSNPQLSRPDMLALRDDKGMITNDHVVPVVRASLLRTYGPALRRTFDDASGLLTTLQLRGLNQQVIDGRLPEAFAGYPRSETRFPVEYPTACSPQAWSTGAPLLLLRTLLGLEPVGERLLFAPAIPTTLERLELLDIPGRWGRADAIGRGRIDLGASAGRS